MKNFFTLLLTLTITLLLSSAPLLAVDKTFSEVIGPVKISEVKNTNLIEVPYITWGGDMAGFYANQGLETKPDSLFAKQGLNLKFKNGDNVVQQVKDYMEGKTPFMRLTFRMSGIVSEYIGSDPRTKGVVIMQLTWSAGDHMVARPGIKTVTDLKGKSIVLQKFGPHVGMLDDILKTANLSWKDVNIVWADDLTGTANSPAEIFRKNENISACFVITPDMIGLTGGLNKVPDKTVEGLIKGAKVLVSTAELSYSIADVYVCRKDFYDTHKDIVTKFVAGYLKGCEEVVELKKQYEAKGNADYLKLCKMGNEIFKLDFPAESEDGSLGMLLDCTFVGHPGNVAFFTQENNPHGFKVFLDKSLELAVNEGYAKVKQGLFPSTLDWNSDAFMKYLTKTEVVKSSKFDTKTVLAEIEKMSSEDLLDEKTIVGFSINFEPNQKEFSSIQYGSEYARVIEALGKFGNAVIAIEGHSDPTQTLSDFVKAGMKKGILKRTGSKEAGYSYSLNGKPLNLDSTKEIIQLINDGQFDGIAESNPRLTLQVALNLSRERADAVRKSIIEYAKTKGIAIDETQIQPLGVGIRDPFIAKPSNMEDAKKNMRVEFKLIRVEAEANTGSDFDF